MDNLVKERVISVDDTLDVVRLPQGLAPCDLPFNDELAERLGRVESDDELLREVRELIALLKPLLKHLPKSVFVPNDPPYITGPKAGQREAAGLPDALMEGAQRNG